MKKVVIYSGFVLLLFSCKKEIGPQNVNEDIVGTGSFLILNEGNFGVGNASVSVYNPATNEISNNQFKTVNGFGIGDVLQSVNRHEDLYYFVVNNSGKVVVTDTNLVFQHEITGFNSPRYIEFYGNKAFVSDLKQKAIYVVDLVSKQITNQIQTQGWTETIIMQNNLIYVLDRGDYLSNSDSNYVYIVNPNSEIKLDSIKTNINPNSMLIENNQLWILSSGKSGINKASLSQFDLSSHVLLKNIKFPSFSDNPSRLVIHPDGKQLFFLNSSVYSQNTSETRFNPTTLIQKGTENFYGLFFDPLQDELYVTDAKDYNQTGDLLKYNTTTKSKTKISCGIIPQFVFQFR